MKAISRLRLNAKKSEVVDEDMLKSSTFEAGMTIEAYKALISNLESESEHLKANTIGTKSLEFSCDIRILKDSCDIVAEDLCKEMDLEEVEETNLCNS